MPSPSQHAHEEEDDCRSVGDHDREACAIHAKRVNHGIHRRQYDRERDGVAYEVHLVLPHGDEDVSQEPHVSGHDRAEHKRNDQVGVRCDALPEDQDEQGLSRKCEQNAEGEGEREDGKGDLQDETRESALVVRMQKLGKASQERRVDGGRSGARFRRRPPDPNDSASARFSDAASKNLALRSR